MSRKPTQVVCHLHEEIPKLQCMEVDVNSCRLNGILEGNVFDVPIFSPLDEFGTPKEGVVADFSWVDLGNVRSPLTCFIWDGPRWYDKQTVMFMLSNGICKWHHILLVFNAKTHRPAQDLACKLRKLRSVWWDVGASLVGETWELKDHLVEGIRWVGRTLFGWGVRFLARTLFATRIGFDRVLRGVWPFWL